MSDFPPALGFLLTLGALWLVTKLLARHLQGLALLLTGSASFAAAAYDLLVLPGVALHELSHMVVALILRVRVVRVNLFQFRRQGDPRQGEVIVERVDALRMSLVGAAPLLTGVPAVLYLLRRMGAPSLELSTVDFSALDRVVRDPLSLPWLYLLWAIATSMFPSAADRAAWWIVGAMLAIGGGLLALSGVSPSLPPRVTELLVSSTLQLTNGLLPILFLNVVLLGIVLILEWLVTRMTGRRIVMTR